MSDEDKRYDPTPARKRRAIAEGNVARSGELTSVAAFGAATLAATVAVPFGAVAAASALVAAAHRPMPGAPLLALGGIACAALLPALAAALCGSTVALAQAGGLHVAGVRLDPKRLDPIAGVKRLFGIDALIGVARAALAFVAALLAMLPVAGDVLAGAIAPPVPAAAAALVGSAALRACVAAIAVGSAFALADYLLVRRRWLRALKMSFEELKRDAKENDGDPQLRARRKQVHRGVTRGGIARTREASFVVVNPTHVAVALRYAPPAVPVPEILVRALDDVALRVRALAREHSIPIVENVALARLLYAHGETGRAIPSDAYVAVAHVIAALAREGVL